MKALLDGGALPASAWLPATTPDILTRAADADEGRLVFAESAMSARDLHASASRAAREWVRGEPVAVPVSDARSLLCTLWGAWLAGAVPVLAAPHRTPSALPSIASDTALLICTSGSTGVPKVVALTHANIAASLAASAFVNGYRPDDVSLNWLPLWHVGGLMRSLRELYVGATQVQLPTTWVREDPLRWIDAIHAHRATVIWGANAAFAAVVARRRELTTRRHWSLECVRSIYSSGEPVVPATMKAWLEMLVPYGLHDGALRVAWGMTEACFATSSASLADVGTPVPGVSMRIVDDEGQIRNEGETGRLQISGPLVAAAGWFDTGDLGCIASGRLRITGRSSDAIRIGGVTYANRDIEAIGESIDGVGSIAACGVQAGDGEALAIFADLDEQQLPRLRAKVAEACGLVPRYVIPLAGEAFPRTDVGKISRAALRDAFAAGAFDRFRRWPYDLHASSAAATGAVTDQERARASEIAAVMSDVLRVAVGIDDDFFALGGSSLRIAQVATRIGCGLPDLFCAPTPLALACRLMRPASRPSPHRAAAASEPIAIVGMAGRFPGAPDIDAFWRLLTDGRDALTTFTEADLRDSGIDPRVIENPAYVRAGMVLDDIESFDADFFGLSSRDAEVMDPQQRLLLECAWHALEDAGRVPGAGADRIGVWVGARQSDYMLFRMPPPDLFGHDDVPAEGLRRLVLNDKDYLATRLAHLLDCRGPAVSVQTACSSALVAVHLACQALRNQECETALAGGVSLRVPQTAGYLYTEGMVFSRDGRTRSFDAAAGGTIFGSGVGVVVLRRLADAIRDGDTIDAVIRGSAINNDGAGPKPAFTAPSHAGQVRVVADALAAAGVEASTVSYIEAHGTGTAVGDPIEIAALSDALAGPRTSACAVGSVKSNIGHLVQAAGVAGLIKSALMLRHRLLVPTVNFETPNPLIDFAASPFHVNTRTRRWDDGPTPRRAGISAFGFGGTNAHVILEEPPAPDAIPDEVGERPRILPLSAKSPAALRALATAYADSQLPLRDLCASAAQGRAHLPHRLAIVASSADELRHKLRMTTIGDAPIGRRPRIAFAFSGQGTQCLDMGRAIYEASPAFRRVIDDAALFDVLFHADLERTDIAQPALIALEIALLEVWRSWGIEPDVVVGHSVGEIAAASAAGIIAQSDAVRFAAARGRLMQQTGTGLMATVFGPLETVAPWSDELTVAAINSPTHTVVSGSRTAVEAALAGLHERGIGAKALPGHRAFHSALMDPILDELEREASRLTLSPPRLPIVSTLTGAPADAAFAGPAYWKRQAREPVHFARAIEAAHADIVVPIGPGHDTPRRMLTILGELYTAGAEVNWQAVESEPWRRVALPKYPFQRKRFWIEARRRELPPSTAVHPLLGRRIPSPLNDVQYEAELTVSVAPFARDHWIYGMRPLVMVAQLEMMRAAAASSSVTIENFVVEQPLLLSDTPLRIHTVRGASGDVRIFSSEDGSVWELHSSASVRAESAGAPRSIDLDAVRARCREEISPATVFASKAAKGAPVGPGVKLLRQVWRGDGEVIAEVSLDAETAQFVAGYVAYPGLLDAIPQCGDLTLDASRAQQATDLFLPTVAERVSFLAPLPERAWIVLHRREGATDEVYGVNAEIADGTGRVLVAVEGLHFKRATPSTLARSGVAYRVDWLPLDAPIAPVDGGRILTAQRDATAQDLCGHALDTVQTMLDRNSDGPLWIVTRGAQTTGRETAPVVPAHAALWGFGRSLQREQSQLRCRLIDLDPALDDQDDVLRRAMALAASEGEIVVRGGTLYGRRLRRIRRSAPIATPYALRSGQHRTIEELTVAPATRREPGPGEIEIEVYCTGVNFRDVLNATGRIDGPLGYECSGVVSRRGAGVTAFEPGMPVMALATASYASHVVIDARLAIQKPANLTFAAAATSVVAYLTAMHGLLDQAGLQRGERVLIHTAAGGVGQAAVHVARAAGADVVATASRAKQALVRSMGVDTVLDSRAPGFSEALAPVDVVLNTLGTEFIGDNLRVLRRGGRLVELGHPDVVDIGAMTERARAASVSFINFHVAQDAGPDRIQQLLATLAGALASGELPALPYRSLSLADAHLAFETMLRGGHVGKFAVMHPAAEQVRFTADPHATYVISGGSGAVGRQIGRWLVDRGARHLALLSRRSIAADEVNTRADIRTFHVDVGRPDDLAWMLAHIERSMPPIRGIVHAAGVLDDGIVAQQSRQRIATVFAPKVDGAWNLHRFASQRPLDFFVLVSSVAGLWGNAGQTTYAAANAYLDQLAHLRRQCGLPATVVDYGAWRGAGMASTLSEAVRSRRAADGAADLTPDAAVRALESALVEDRTQTAVFAGSSPLLAETVAARSPSPLEPAVPPRDLEDAIDRVRHHVSSLSGATEVGIDRSLPELGLDSLSVLLLRGRLIAEFGSAAALPIVRFLQGATVAELASAIIGHADVPAPSPSSTLTPLKTNGSRAPILLVPPALRTAFRYATLAKAFDGHPVYGLTPVGLDGRSAAHDSVEQMAAQYIRDLRAVRPSGPCIVGGACFGGLVAWEMARQLTREGVAVPLLILIDTAPPIAPLSRSPARRSLNLVSASLRWVSFRRRWLAELVRQQMLRRWVAARLRGERLRGEGHLDAVLSAHLSALQQYQAAPFDGNVLLLQSNEYAHYAKQWRHLARGRLEIVPVPGTSHVDLVGEAYADTVAAIISERLKDPTA